MPCFCFFFKYFNDAVKANENRWLFVINHALLRHAQCQMDAWDPEQPLPPGGLPFHCRTVPERMDDIWTDVRGVHREVRLHLRHARSEDPESEWMTDEEEKDELDPDPKDFPDVYRDARYIKYNTNVEFSLVPSRWLPWLSRLSEQQRQVIRQEIVFL